MAELDNSRGVRRFRAAATGSFSGLVAFLLAQLVSTHERVIVADRLVSLLPITNPFLRGCGYVLVGIALIWVAVHVLAPLMPFTMKHLREANKVRLDMKDDNEAFGRASRESVLGAPATPWSVYSSGNAFERRTYR